MIPAGLQLQKLRRQKWKLTSSPYFSSFRSCCSEYTDRNKPDRAGDARYLKTVEVKIRARDIRLPTWPKGVAWVQRQEEPYIRPQPAQFKALLNHSFPLHTCRHLPADTTFMTWEHPQKKILTLNKTKANCRKLEGRDETTKSFPTL